LPNPSAILDTRHHIETPEGVLLPVDMAGPPVRAMAYLIDLALRVLLQLLISIMQFLLGYSGIGVAAILFFLLEWFYPVYFEVWRQGMTPGKRIMGLVVLHDDGTPVSFGASVTRNLLRVADFFPGFYCAGLIAASIHPQFKRLGDLAAGTIVVHRNTPSPRKLVNAVGVDLPHIVLTRAEQQTIVNFAERHAGLSTERQEELAEIVAPIFGTHDDSAALQLLRIANGIAQ
jgi:uncharacterized RDD family membrane protein YckC